MPSKLEAFLADKKINQKKLLAVSVSLEALRPEDRAIKLIKRQNRKSEDEAKKKSETRKTRSGHPVNEVALAKIFAGKPVSGPTKSRVLRAVNAILAQKKGEPVALDALFDLAKKE